MRGEGRKVADGGSDLQCTCYRLRKATRRVTAAYDEALAPLGLTATQMSVLAVASGGRRTVSALAEALGMDVSTLSRTLSPLVRRGVVALRPGTDRRRREVELTPAGRDLAACVAPAWRQAQARVERALGAEVAELHDLLGRLTAKL